MHNAFTSSKLKVLVKPKICGAEIVDSLLITNTRKLTMHAKTIIHLVAFKTVKPKRKKRKKEHKDYNLKSKKN